MKLAKEQIEEIADLLISGQLCFVNKINCKIEYFPQDTDMYLDDENPWLETQEKVDRDFDNYIKCEPMDSNQSFNVMRDFTEIVESQQLQQNLIEALNRPKPFRNFKYLLENAGDHRQQWFSFMRKKNVLWVEEQLHMGNHLDMESIVVEKSANEIELNQWEFQLIMGDSWEMKDIIIEDIFCECDSGEKKLIEYKVYLDKFNNLILKGKCSGCNTIAARYIETGENPDNFKVAERIRKMKISRS